MSAYPAHLYPGCPCYTCDSKTWSYPGARMTLCPRCGDKRCPAAHDHAMTCQLDEVPA